MEGMNEKNNGDSPISVRVIGFFLAVVVGVSEWTMLPLQIGQIKAFSCVFPFILGSWVQYFLENMLAVELNDVWRRT